MSEFTFSLNGYTFHAMVKRVHRHAEFMLTKLENGVPVNFWHTRCPADADVNPNFAVEMAAHL